MPRIADATQSSALSTPVVLFVFNRPELTRGMMAKIRAARPQHFLVVADGPRADRANEAALCAETRRIVCEGTDWPCTFRTEFATANLGCGQRIFSGLQWAFSQVEEAIILEDDCIPHATFFRYCEDMLTRFRAESRVFMVAGTNFRGAQPESAGRYLLSRHSSIWGWATWRRALAGYTLDLSWWRTTVDPAQLRSLCRSAHEHRLVCDWFDAQRSGRVDTWDVQWFAHIFRQNGLSVVPGTNLISNHGVTGSHAQGAGPSHLLSTSAARFPLCGPDKLKPDDAYDRYLVERHRPFGGWTLGPLAAWMIHGPAGPPLRRGWRLLKRLASGPRAAGKS